MAIATELRSPVQRPSTFAYITPNWYAAVMGTGIVATAADTLPSRVPGQHAAAVVVWALAAALLATITTATVVHWTRHRAVALTHHRNPVMAHFYGAPPMALLTVGTGTLLLGQDLIGAHLAVVVDGVLWSLGTLLGLASAAAVPYLTFTRHDVRPDAAFGGWLMPVVPPMVSAASGALLLPHLPPGPARLTMLLGCYAMFGLSLLASMVVITLLCAKLARHGVGPAQLVPTLFIVLGPLGQSVTAANLLGGNAHLAIGAPYSTALQAFGVVYGVPVIGFAALWAALAAAITIRTARLRLPFSLTWWSFTFPIGTCVTGLGALAVHTGSVAFRWAAVAGFAVLVVAWVLVATRTARGMAAGTLLRAPVPTPASTDYAI
jgi:C4-dicarboxylate transporter/malic acid transport protein